jgi:hypothetical protein
MVTGLMRCAAPVIALVLGALPATALAGETQCWIDNGAVVVPAALGDIAGDFLFDLSAPKSQLHLTRAQGDGLDAPVMAAPLRLASETIPARFDVADLDARSWGFPSTINGLIGADVLAGYVVDLRFSPCRLTLSRRPGPFKAAERLPLRWVGGVPAVRASISDGASAQRGEFAVDTGALGVRVSDAAAKLSRTPKGLDAASRDRPPARLAALGLGGEALTRIPAGLEPATPGLLGGIGMAVWSRYDVRLDLRRMELELAPSLRPSRRPLARAPQDDEDRELPDPRHGEERLSGASRTTH